MPEGFPLVRIAEVNLDDRSRDRLDRVVQRHRRMAIAAGIDDHRLRPPRLRLVQPVDQMSFMVGLTDINRYAKILRLRDKPRR